MKKKPYTGRRSHILGLISEKQAKIAKLRTEENEIVKELSVLWSQLSK